MIPGVPDSAALLDPHVSAAAKCIVAALALLVWRAIVQMFGAPPSNKKLPTKKPPGRPPQG